MLSSKFGAGAAGATPAIRLKLHRMLRLLAVPAPSHNTRNGTRLENTILLKPL
jgi:hypothetical protein